MKNMGKKSMIIILILLLAVGFASVSGTLVLSGRFKVQPKDDNFDVVFTEAEISKKMNAHVNISDDKKTLTFNTGDLSSVGEISNLVYSVKNTSSQLNAKVNVSCEIERNEYVVVYNRFDVTNIYDEITTTLKAQGTKTGLISIKVMKVNESADDIKINVKCQIKAEPIDD